MKLLATLYWSSQPAETLNDYAGTGATIDRSITVAESHDGSDLTYERVSAPDDQIGMANGNADLWLERALDTASVSGQIAHVVVKSRAARTNLTNCVGQHDVVMDGTKIGTADTLTGSAANYSRTFTTDPADGQPWTNAKINAKTWGAVLTATSTAPSFNRTPAATLYEWSVEVWGQDAQPSPLQVGAALVAPLVVPGAIAIAAGLLAVGCSLVTPTVTNSSSSTVASPAPIGVSAALVAPSVSNEDFETISRIGIADLRAVQVGPIRAMTPANLGDADATTVTGARISPGNANPAGGTIEVVATAMQPAAGSGAIAYVRFRAIASRPDIYDLTKNSNYRVRFTVDGDSAEAAITNDDPAFEASTGVGGPVVIRRDSDGIQADDEMVASYYVGTGNVATQPNGFPWSWGALAALEEVAIAYDYDAGVEWADLDVAEIFIDVYGVENRGTNKRPLEFPLQIGHGRKRIGLGTNPPKTKLALPKPLKFTMPLGGE